MQISYKDCENFRLVKNGREQEAINAINAKSIG